MKIMIASDLHGSSKYCRALLDAHACERPDKLLLLGDLLYHGPRNNLPDEYDTRAVAQMLNAVRDELMCVRGNCDCDVDQMVLEFPILADYALLYAGGRMIFATHGHLFNESKLPMLKRGDILLHGHTHVSVCREHEHYTYVNPGSVSLPKENTPRGYMLLTDEGFVWKTLEGEIYRTYQF